MANPTPPPSPGRITLEPVFRHPSRGPGSCGSCRRIARTILASLRRASAATCALIIRVCFRKRVRRNYAQLQHDGLAPHGQVLLPCADVHVIWQYLQRVHFEGWGKLGQQVQKKAHLYQATSPASEDSSLCRIGQANPGSRPELPFAYSPSSPGATRVSGPACHSQSAGLPPSCWKSLSAVSGRGRERTWVGKQENPAHQHSHLISMTRIM